ncbi:MAG: hypothetical protein QOC73_1447, partial [Actinomycetota bacterium]|nr:hypothetical protein [Actinomycetota bacterium]
MSGVLSWFGSLGLWTLSLIVLLGAVPNAVTVLQVVFASLHRFRDHYGDEQVDPLDLPRVAVLVPAWNEA